MLQNSVEYKRFVWEFENIINQNKNYDNFTFLCIGTTSIIGDSFGPIVGKNLKEYLYDIINIKVVGDMQKSVTYNEIITKKFYDEKFGKEQKNLIIAIDSALSFKKNIGKVFVHNRGLKYAESLQKKNSIIGDISIKAVVGENKNNCLKNFSILQDVTLDKIEKMSNLVSTGIVEVMYKKNNIGKNICK